MFRLNFFCSDVPNLSMSSSSLQTVVILFSGDNPVVTEKLKLVAEQRRRQTRSVKSMLEQKQPSKGNQIF